MCLVCALYVPCRADLSMCLVGPDLSMCLVGPDLSMCLVGPDLSMCLVKRGGGHAKL